MYVGRRGGDRSDRPGHPIGQAVPVRRRGQCATFEKRYAAYLGASHFALSASGAFALTAGLTAMGIGPGDEVIIPAHTYMATATAVLAVGAIPVIVDVPRKGGGNATG